MVYIINLLFLPVLIFLGAITSLEDFSAGKIRNKWIAFGAIWGLSVLILLFIWSLVASPVTKFVYLDLLDRAAGTPIPVLTVKASFIIKSVLNFLAAGLAGFFLWKFRAWAAGDAKLFAVCALLIPLYFYSRAYFFIFPSFVLLINIFCIFLGYLLVRSGFFHLKLFWLKFRSGDLGGLARFLKSLDRAAAVKFLRQLVFPLALISLVSFFQKKFESHFDVEALQPFIFASLIFLAKPIEKISKNKIFFGACILILMAAVCFILIPNFSDGLVILFQTLKLMILFLFFFALFQKAVTLYVARTLTEEIEIGCLQEGMMADQSVYCDAGMPPVENSFGFLTRDQAEKIKNHFAIKQRNSVKIIRGCSFAGWIFAGVLMTLILQNSILGILLRTFLF